MGKIAPQTKPRSRKDALKGQLSPAERAQAGVSSTMSRLDEMMRGLSSDESAAESATAQPPLAMAPKPAPEAADIQSPLEPATTASHSTEEPASAPVVEAAPESSAAAPSEPVSSESPTASAPSVSAARPVESLEELARLINGAVDTLFATVPVRLITPSAENHRLLALPFDVFRRHLPAPPADWRTLDPEEYVDRYWEPVLQQMLDADELDAHTHERAREQLKAQFGIGQSVHDTRQLHPASGYLRFDEDGKPYTIELTSGEQRLRGYLMVGKEHALVDFPTDAAKRDHDPMRAYHRQHMRVAENMKSTGLSVAEKLTALSRLVSSLATAKGQDVVDSMTYNQLSAHFSTAIAMSKASAARYLKVVRSPQAKTLIDACDRLSLGIAKVTELATSVEHHAAYQKREQRPADVYYCALKDATLQVSLHDVPTALRSEVAAELNPSAGEALADRAQTAPVAPRAPARSGKTTNAESSRRSRSNRSAYQTRLQNTMGWSVSKGPSHAEAHRNLYTNALLLVTLLEAPSIPPERVEQLRELSRLQGIPSELDNYRAALAELVDSYQLPISSLNQNHLQSQELLDRLAQSDNSVDTLREYLKEQQNTTGSSS